MTGFKSYFRTHLRSSVKTLIYLIIITLVLTVILGMNNQVIKSNWSDKRIYYNSTLYIPVLFLASLIYLVPMLEFSFFKKRINLNCAYSMPISRRAMCVVHYLSGAITITTVYTLSYLANFIMLLTIEPGHFIFTPMIPHYFLTLLFGLAIYSLMCFVFNEANTAGDGICFMILWTLVLFFVNIAAANIFKFSVNTASGSIPWDLISQFTGYYQRLCEMNSAIPRPFWMNHVLVNWLFVWILIGLASAFGLFFTFGKRRMEETEEISDSFFGYRVLIPIYAATGMYILRGWLFWVIFEVLALIGYTIYRRGFRYKPSDIIILLSLLIFLIFI